MWLASRGKNARVPSVARSMNEPPASRCAHTAKTIS
jgi:hypothetical protein